MTAIKRPIMQYKGGSWKIAPWVIEHLPPHNVYVEPFGGGGAVLLKKPRVKIEVYNDIDAEVVNLFRVLQKPYTFNELKGKLLLTPYSRQEFDKAHTPTQDPVERARRLLVRNWLGFGSGGLSMSPRGFATSKVRDNAGIWSTWLTQIDSYVERLQGVVIEHKSAVDLIPLYDTPDTVFYVAPPYLMQTRTAGKSYNHEMTAQDHEALAGVLHGVEGFVVLGGYANPLYDDELYKGWQRIDKGVRSVLTVKRVESLWLSPRTTTALKQTRPPSAPQLFEIQSSPE